MGIISLVSWDANSWTSLCSRDWRGRKWSKKRKSLVSRVCKQSLQVLWNSLLSCGLFCAFPCRPESRQEQDMPRAPPRQAVGYGGTDLALKPIFSKSLGGEKADHQVLLPIFLGLLATHIMRSRSAMPLFNPKWCVQSPDKAGFVPHVKIITYPKRW